MGGISLGILAPIVTGYIVDRTGSFAGAFYFAGSLLFVGAFTAITMTRKPLSFSEEAAI
jgi:ACS family glucarate transporter-like MFS transporter